MKRENSGLVYDAANRPENERVAAFVSLCALESGTLLCGFQLGRRKHDVASTLRFSRSVDDGATWRDTGARFESTIDGVPGSLSSGEVVEVEPGRQLLYATWFDRSQPDRPLFDPETEGILHSKQLLAESTDEGESWTPWRELPTPGLTGCSSTGPILKWPNGTIALALESYKEFDDPQPARHAAWLVVSTDGGRTFDEPLLVARRPEDSVYYWDQRLCVGPGADGLLAMFWTHDRAEKKDLTVHCRRMSLTGSLVDAHPITDTGIPGQIAAPLILPDGRILAFVVNRGGPRTMKLWQSSDGGARWPERDALVIYEHDERAALSQGTTNIDFDQYWEDMAKWSFGHPAIRPLPNGRVLLAYYAGTPENMSVHWARVDASI